MSAKVSLAFLLIILTSPSIKCAAAGSNSSANDSNAVQTESFTLSFSLPYNDGVLSDMNVVVALNDFQLCQNEECLTICGSKNPKLAYCDLKNTKLCMCKADNFYTSDLEGTVASVDRKDELHKNCSIACNKRMSYARIYTKPDKTMQCTCLTGQVTSTGITLCDEFAVSDICKSICQTDSAVCAFNGVCLCRKTWEQVYNLSMPSIRKQEPKDQDECLNRCTAYHHDYRSRIFDIQLGKAGSNATYKFREKFCLCGDWLDVTGAPETAAIVAQGFQICTGLKCKRRCGMDEAMCEHPFRRACLCNRENIIIGSHLWSRLPSHEETRCYEACSANGLDARVIEWNPFFTPENQKFVPNYKKSEFQYLYDGKFCHCVQVQNDMHQYRPCTDEMCRIVCNHKEAECDKRTRRACFCNTHEILMGVGRKPDPGEINCDIACRYGLSDARILDVRWEVPLEKWSVKVAKYCTCVRPVTPAGITHCDPYRDECPRYCNKPEAYCTKERYCHCGVVDKMLNNPMVRLGDGKEQDECGEKCRSWLWPVAEDVDNKPYIYDETLETCSATKSCPKIDTSPWKLDRPGSLSVSIDALENASEDGNRRFCLCAKSVLPMHSPGTRFLMHLEPERFIPDKVPCAPNHVCEVVGKGIHIVA